MPSIRSKIAKSFKNNDPQKRAWLITQFLTSSGLPLSTVESDAFVTMRESLIGREMPSLAELEDWMEWQFDYGKEAVQMLISGGHRFIITMDVWGKKCPTAFLAISVYFYNHVMDKTQYFLLNLFQLDRPYNVDTLSEKLKNCLKQWQINSEKILIVVTDDVSCIDSHDGDYDSMYSLFMFEVDLPSLGLSHKCNLVLADLYNTPVPVAKKAISLLEKISKSHLVTEKLVKYKSFLELTRGCHVTKKCLKMKTLINEIILELDLDSWTEDEWSDLEKNDAFLDRATQNLFELTNNTPLSNVVPFLLNLSYKLQEIECPLSEIMLNSLKKHFHCIMEPEKPLFYGMFSAACLLDPTVGHFLLGPGFNKFFDGAIKYIKNTTSDPVTIADENPPLPKRFKFLDKQVSESGILTPKSLLDVEISQYIYEFGSNRPIVTAHGYWLSKKSSYPILSSLALDLVTLDISQASRRRVFPVDVELINRTKMIPPDLEKSAFLKINGEIFDIDSEYLNIPI